MCSTSKIDLFPSLSLIGPELLGVGSLLKKYTALLCTHIGDILPVAISIAFTSHRHFAEVSRVVDGDLTGTSLLEKFCFSHCLQIIW